MSVIIMSIIGLIISRIIFKSFPRLSKKDYVQGYYKLSIIIPARNEEKNLSLLLNDLKHQSIYPDEIICVDDCSTDRTKDVIIENNVTLVSITDKPEGWMGKSWACQRGVEKSTGDLLLFLDADVRLNSNGLRRILSSYFKLGCAISVQPYHKIRKVYEELAMFFNIILVGANGLGMPKSEEIGLYGPINLISKLDYDAFGGHESVKSVVLEDLALGVRMKEFNIPYKTFIGDKDVSFRMYGGGFSDMFNGFLKSFSSGAASTPIFRLIGVFIWIASLISLPIYTIIELMNPSLVFLSIYILLYVLWVLEIRRISIKVGNFSLLNITLYPISLIFFVVVFTISLIRKIFNIKTVWKGRKI